MCNVAATLSFMCKICITSTLLIVHHACKMQLKYEICASNYLFLTFYTEIQQY